MSDEEAPVTGQDATTTAADDDETLVLPPPRPKPRLSLVTAVFAMVLLLAAAFYGGIRAHQAWGGETDAASAKAVAVAAAAGKDAGAAKKDAGAEKAAAGKAAAGWAFGQVTAVAGRTLFLAGKDGSIVAVEVPAYAQVTRTQDSTFRQIRPGDIVTATGETSPNGVIVAASVSVGASGKAGLDAKAVGK